MLRFRVHFHRADGTKDSFVVAAKNPADAKAYIVGRFPGALVGKIKRWKPAGQEEAPLQGDSPSEPMRGPVRSQAIKDRDSVRT